jgi:hypothetical protein
MDAHINDLPFPAAAISGTNHKLENTSECHVSAAHHTPRAMSIEHVHQKVCESLKNFNYIVGNFCTLQENGL